MTHQGRYPAAQDAFIKRIHRAVDANPFYFTKCDWKRINPTGGRFTTPTSKISVESFYVKPVACWVPHLIIQGHTPTCPRCNSNEYVDVNRSKWISSPKILYGLCSHRYLDTKLYPCSVCNAWFTGYDKGQLKADSNQYSGLFNFTVGRRCSMDDEVFRFLVNSNMETNAMVTLLHKKTCDKYLEDYMYYLGLVRHGRIRNKSSSVPSYR